MLQRLSVQSFMAFERFRLDLRGDAFLAGPNNAGKSTLIAAIRAAAQMLRIAMRRNPTESFLDGREEVLGYAFSDAQVGLDTANLRHEFREVETRLSARFRNGSVVTAVWPKAEDAEAFFYLQQGRSSINNVRQARDAFPDVGTIPVLAPIENEEELLTTKYVRDNLDGRLASRHFRNQLLLISDASSGEDLDAFLEFARPWLSEIEIKELSQHAGERNVVLDLYYTEPERRAMKELTWAGGGLQIWLQLLLHVFRLRDRDVIVLDEPDVFLHPDLQRRLVWLLESLPAQTITATHSSEVLVEASPGSVVWIDKTRRSSVSSPTDSELSDLTRSLGTQFNIRLARALRAKCVLFVEGKDAKTLRQFARAIGAPRVANERGIAIIPLQGFDNWTHIEPFAWMSEALLEQSVEVFALLDRDYRPESECRALRDRLRKVNVYCHVWRRKELESYLLETATIARLTGAGEPWVEDALASAAEQQEDEVFAQITAGAIRRFRHDQKTQAITEARKLFREAWQDRTGRKWLAPPELVLHGLNRRLADAGFSTTSFEALARQISADELAPEVAGFLERIEAALTIAGVPGPSD
jgi:predicted ATP-dependent endonuclease of OLD family